jgi:hypothetical protein
MYSVVGDNINVGIAELSLLIKERDGLAVTLEAIAQSVEMVLSSRAIPVKMRPGLQAIVDVAREGLQIKPSPLPPKPKKGAAECPKSK